jgi:hypothetical protein
MARISRQLRSRRKVIAVWAMLLCVGGAGWITRYCRNDGRHICAAGAEYLTLLQTPAYAITLGLGVLLPALLIWRRRWKALSVPGFKNQPWLFDRHILEVAGRIEYVMGDTVGEKLKRKATDMYRNATGNEDWRNRYIHQRFLLSSPSLRGGERVMILHNTKYGNLPLREGAWVRVRGEYLHGDERKNSFFNGRHFYGQIHFTHEPRGFVELLSGRPDDCEVKDI